MLFLEWVEFTLLESATFHCIYQIKDQDLKVEYKIPVEVQKWDFRILIYGQRDPDQFLFVWQTSNDKT